MTQADSMKVLTLIWGNGTLSRVYVIVLPFSVSPSLLVCLSISFFSYMFRFALFYFFFVYFASLFSFLCLELLQFTRFSLSYSFVYHSPLCFLFCLDLLHVARFVSYSFLVYSPMSLLFYVLTRVLLFAVCLYHGSVCTCVLCSSCHCSIVIFRLSKSVYYLFIYYYLSFLILIQHRKCRKQIISYERRAKATAK